MLLDAPKEKIQFCDKTSLFICRGKKYLVLNAGEMTALSWRARFLFPLPAFYSEWVPAPCSFKRFAGDL